MRFGEHNDLNRLGERKQEYVCVSKREREKWGSREIEREVKDWRKEGNGLRGRGFVREFVTKKLEDFMMGRADLGKKMS